VLVAGAELADNALIVARVSQTDTKNREALGRADGDAFDFEIGGQVFSPTGSLEERHQSRIIERPVMRGQRRLAGRLSRRSGKLRR
jgi:hypothetical protein